MTHQYGFGTTLQVSYEEAIPRVRDALKAEGFGVLTEIDVRQTLREKLGVEMVRMLFMIEDLGAEPVKQRFLIGVVELAHLGHLTDLCSVCFDDSPFPSILGKESGINTDLDREKSHHIGSHLNSRTEKPAFVMQTLE